MGWLSNAISAVGSFISGVASNIGTVVSNFAKSTLSIMTKLPIPGLGIVNAISTAASIIHGVVKILGIKTEEDPEILGAKAEQSEKSLDDFDNDVESYIKYLKEEVQLDKERFEELTPEEKLGCKAIGMALETKVVEEKIGSVEISPECLGTLVKIHSAGIDIDSNELVNIIKILKDQGITKMSDVVDALEGKGNSDRIKTNEALKTALGENSEEKIYELQDAVRKYEEE